MTNWITEHPELALLLVYLTGVFSGILGIVVAVLFASAKR